MDHTALEQEETKAAQESHHETNSDTLRSDDAESAAANQISSGQKIRSQEQAAYELEFELLDENQLDKRISGGSFDVKTISRL